MKTKTFKLGPEGFERTGEVRVPLEYEYYYWNSCALQRLPNYTYLGACVPILRKLPEVKTPAALPPKAAGGRMNITIRCLLRLLESEDAFDKQIVFGDKKRCMEIHAAIVELLQSVEALENRA